MKKIVFISHDGSRTGAPILLLNIIKLIKETGKYELVAVFKNGGPIEEDYQDVVKTYTWNKQIKRPLPKGIIQRFKNKFWPIDYDQLNKHSIVSEMTNADYIINNTITNGDLLEILTQNFKGKVISYVHELKMSVLKYATNEGVDKTIQLSHQFITPSLAVKQFLNESFTVPVEKISVLNSYINIFSTPVSENNNSNKTFTVGSSGTIELRKGTDLFVAVAKYLKTQKHDLNISFLWKGMNGDSETLHQIRNDIKKANLEDVVRFIPSDNDMDSFYKEIDVFLLASREDPYPLVVLEAASYGKPIICFDNAGGAPEFVQDDAGTVVEYLDIIGLANAVDTYHKNPDLVKQEGNIAKERVQKKHQDKNLVLAQLNQILND